MSGRVRKLCGWTARRIPILGLLAIGFVLGAAVLHFEWPTSSLLRSCLATARTWWQTPPRPKPPADPDAPPEVSILDAGKIFEGPTLYTSGTSSQATLIDEHGKIVHRWSALFSDVWPEPRPAHVEEPLPDSTIHWGACRLFPNGDLLALFEAHGEKPYGYGMVKLDSKSQVLWRYAANFHHAIEVGEDGKIYTLSHKHHEDPSVPGLVESLVILSADGKLLEEVPLKDALAASAFKTMLGGGHGLPPHMIAEGMGISKGDEDYDCPGWEALGANFVQVVTPKLAQQCKAAGAKAGQVLISLGKLDAVVLLDPATRKVVWAAIANPWRGQHSPQLLADGRLLILDSVGGRQHDSRVLEYDPLTREVVWSYPDQFGSAEFSVPFRGLVQRLPNGNTLIVNCRKGELLEVNRDRELVWHCTCPSRMLFAHRYGPEELTFLTSVEEPRTK